MNDKPTLITAMPVHGRHSRIMIDMIEYGQGWDAHEAGKPLDEAASFSWKQGWIRRNDQST